MRALITGLILPLCAALGLWWLARAGIAPGSALDLLRPGPDVVAAYKHLPGAALHLHVFRARGPRPSATAPLLVFVHGGGWEVGDASQFYPQCRVFSARGLDCVSVEYRVRSRHGSSPGDAVQDLRDALRHLRRHHAALGLPLAHLVLGGGSAGGHLAAAMATALPWPDPDADAQASTRPDAVLLYNPMLDLSPGMPDHTAVAAHWQTLSPQHQIDAATSPTLVMSGSQDPEVAVATVQRYVQGLQAVGVRARAVVYPGAGHGFFNPDGWRNTGFHQTNAETWRFLVELGWVPADGGR